jgi:hypothetical protein
MKNYDKPAMPIVERIFDSEIGEYYNATVEHGLTKLEQGALMIAQNLSSQYDANELLKDEFKQEVVSSSVKLAKAILEACEKEGEDSK